MRTILLLFISAFFVQTALGALNPASKWISISGDRPTYAVERLQTVWQPVPTLPPWIFSTPAQRTGGMLWADDYGNVYLYGGHNGGDLVSNYPSVSINGDFWKFENTTNEWKQIIAGTWNIAPVGNELRSLTRGAVAKVHDEIFVFGGSLPILGSSNTNSIWKRRNDEIGPWIQEGTNLPPAGDWLGPNPYPSARHSSIACYNPAIDGLTVFGGYGVDSNFNEGWLNDLWYYSAGEWTNVYGEEVFAYSKGNESLPAGLQGYASACDPDSGKIYLYGGYSPTAGFTYSGVWEFDPLTSAWTLLTGSRPDDGGNEPSGASNPGARFYASVVLDPNSNDLWIIGGRLYTHVPSSETWRFSIATQSFMLISQSPTSTIGVQRQLSNAHIFADTEAQAVYSNVGGGAIFRLSGVVNEFWVMTSEDYFAPSLSPPTTLPQLLNPDPSGVVITISGRNLRHQAMIEIKLGGTNYNCITLQASVTATSAPCLIQGPIEGVYSATVKRFSDISPSPAVDVAFVVFTPQIADNTGGLFGHSVVDPLTSIQISGFRFAPNAADNQIVLSSGSCTVTSVTINYPDYDIIVCAFNETSYPSYGPLGARLIKYDDPTLRSNEAIIGSVIDNTPPPVPPSTPYPPIADPPLPKDAIKPVTVIPYIGYRANVFLPSCAEDTYSWKVTLTATSLVTISIEVDGINGTFFDGPVFLRSFFHLPNYAHDNIHYDNECRVESGTRLQCFIRKTCNVHSTELYLTVGNKGNVDVTYNLHATVKEIATKHIGFSEEPFEQWRSPLDEWNPLDFESTFEFLEFDLPSGTVEFVDMLTITVGSVEGSSFVAWVGLRSVPIGVNSDNDCNIGLCEVKPGQDCTWSISGCQIRNDEDKKAFLTLSILPGVKYTIQGQSMKPFIVDKTPGAVAVLDGKYKIVNGKPNNVFFKVNADPDQALTVSVESINGDFTLTRIFPTSNECATTTLPCTTSGCIHTTNLCDHRTVPTDQVLTYYYYVTANVDSNYGSESFYNFRASFDPRVVSPLKLDVPVTGGLVRSNSKSYVIDVGSVATDRWLNILVYVNSRYGEIRGTLTFQDAPKRDLSCGSLGTSYTCHAEYRLPCRIQVDPCKMKLNKARKYTFTLTAYDSIFVFAEVEYTVKASYDGPIRVKSLPAVVSSHTFDNKYDQPYAVDAGVIPVGRKASLYLGPKSGGVRLYHAYGKPAGDNQHCLGAETIIQSEDNEVAHTFFNCPAFDKRESQRLFIDMYGDQNTETPLGFVWTLALDDEGEAKKLKLGATVDEYISSRTLYNYTFEVPNPDGRSALYVTLNPQGPDEIHLTVANAESIACAQHTEAYTRSTSCRGEVCRIAINPCRLKDNQQSNRWFVFVYSASSEPLVSYKLSVELEKFKPRKLELDTPVTSCFPVGKYSVPDNWAFTVPKGKDIGTESGIIFDVFVNSEEGIGNTPMVYVGVGKPGNSDTVGVGSCFRLDYLCQSRESCSVPVPKCDVVPGTYTVSVQTANDWFAPLCYTITARRKDGSALLSDATIMQGQLDREMVRLDYNVVKNASVTGIQFFVESTSPNYFAYISKPSTKDDGECKCSKAWEICEPSGIKSKCLVEVDHCDLEDGNWGLGLIPSDRVSSDRILAYKARATAVVGNTPIVAGCTRTLHKLVPRSYLHLETPTMNPQVTYEVSLLRVNTTASSIELSVYFNDKGWATSNCNIKNELCFSENCTFTVSPCEFDANKLSYSIRNWEDADVEFFLEFCPSPSPRQIPNQGTVTTTDSTNSDVALTYSLQTAANEAYQITLESASIGQLNVYGGFCEGSSMKRCDILVQNGKCSIVLIPCEIQNVGSPLKITITTTNSSTTPFNMEVRRLDLSQPIALSANYNNNITLVAGTMRTYFYRVTDASSATGRKKLYFESSEAGFSGATAIFFPGSLRNQDSCSFASFPVSWSSPTCCLENQDYFFLLNGLHLVTDATINIRLLVDQEYTIQEYNAAIFNDFTTSPTVYHQVTHSLTDSTVGAYLLVTAEGLSGSTSVYMSTLGPAGSSTSGGNCLTRNRVTCNLGVGNICRRQFFACDLKTGPLYVALLGNTDASRVKLRIETVTPIVLLDSVEYSGESYADVTTQLRYTPALPTGKTRFTILDYIQISTTKELPSALNWYLDWNEPAGPDSSPLQTQCTSSFRQDTSATPFVTGVFLCDNAASDELRLGVSNSNNYTVTIEQKSIPAENLSPTPTTYLNVNETKFYTFTLPSISTADKQIYIYLANTSSSTTIHFYGEAFCDSYASCTTSGTDQECKILVDPCSVTGGVYYLAVLPTASLVNYTVGYSYVAADIATLELNEYHRDELLPARGRQYKVTIPGHRLDDSFSVQISGISCGDLDVFIQNGRQACPSSTSSTCSDEGGSCIYTPTHCTLAQVGRSEDYYIYVRAVPTSEINEPTLKYTIRVLHTPRESQYIRLAAGEAVPVKLSDAPSIVLELDHSVIYHSLSIQLVYNTSIASIVDLRFAAERTSILCGSPTNTIRCTSSPCILRLPTCVGTEALNLYYGVVSASIFSGNPDYPFGEDNVVWGWISVPKPQNPQMIHVVDSVIVDGYLGLNEWEMYQVYVPKEETLNPYKRLRAEITKSNADLSFFTPTNPWDYDSTHKTCTGGSKTIMRWDSNIIYEHATFYSFAVKSEPGFGVNYTIEFHYGEPIDVIDPTKCVEIPGPYYHSFVPPTPAKPTEIYKFSISRAFKLSLSTAEVYDDLKAQVVYNMYYPTPLCSEGFVSNGCSGSWRCPPISAFPNHQDFVVLQAMTTNAGPPMNINVELIDVAPTPLTIGTPVSGDLDSKTENVWSGHYYSVEAQFGEADYYVVRLEGSESTKLIVSSSSVVAGDDCLLDTKCVVDSNGYCQLLLRPCDYKKTVTLYFHVDGGSTYKLSITKLTPTPLALGSRPTFHITSDEYQLFSVALNEATLANNIGPLRISLNDQKSRGGFEMMYYLNDLSSCGSLVSVTAHDLENCFFSPRSSVVYIVTHFTTKGLCHPLPYGLHAEFLQAATPTVLTGERQIFTLDRELLTSSTPKRFSYEFESVGDFPKTMNYFRVIPESPGLQLGSRIISARKWESATERPSSCSQSSSSYDIFVDHCRYRYGGTKSKFFLDIEVGSYPVPAVGLTYSIQPITTSWELVAPNTVIDGDFSTSAGVYDYLTAYRFYRLKEATASAIIRLTVGNDARTAVQMQLNPTDCDFADPFVIRQCYPGQTCTIEFSSLKALRIPHRGDLALTLRSSSVGQYKLEFSSGSRNCKGGNLPECSAFGLEFGSVYNIGNSTARNEYVKDRVFDMTRRFACPDVSATKCLTEVSDDCGLQIRKYVCRETSPICNGRGEKQPMCRETCEAVEKACGKTFSEVGLDHLKCSHSSYLTNSGLCAGEEYSPIKVLNDGEIAGIVIGIIALIIIIIVIIILVKRKKD